MILYYLNLWLHILAAFVWLGGMFFLSLVLAPITRKMESPSLRGYLLTTVGRRFKVAGWISIIILLVTGVINVSNRWGLALLNPDELLSSETGRVLLMKMVLVAVMVLLSILHDFWLAPRMTAVLRTMEAGDGDKEKRSKELLKIRITVTMLARTNTIFGMLLVMVAAVLAR